MPDTKTGKWKYYDNLWRYRDLSQKPLKVILLLNNLYLPKLTKKINTLKKNLLLKSWKQINDSLSNSTSSSSSYVGLVLIQSEIQSSRQRSITKLWDLPSWMLLLSHAYIIHAMVRISHAGRRAATGLAGMQHVATVLSVSEKSSQLVSGMMTPSSHSR